MAHGRPGHSIAYYYQDHGKDGSNHPHLWGMVFPTLHHPQKLFPGDGGHAMLQISLIVLFLQLLSVHRLNYLIDGLYLIRPFQRKSLFRRNQHHQLFSSLTQHCLHSVAGSRLATRFCMPDQLPVHQLNHRVQHKFHEIRRFCQLN